MWLERLVVEHLRLFDHTDVVLGPGVNQFVGPNGAGKTSLLEAVTILASGRSFRGGVRDGLIRRGEAELRIYAELHPGSDRPVRRLGVRRGFRDWSARVDGQDVFLLSDVSREIAAICFEPGSHALIAGSSEQRRRFVDWALFHVEQAFLPTWRAYQRALKQRNALLKLADADPNLLDAWDAEMAVAGERLTEMRRGYLARFEPVVLEVAHRFLPEAGQLNLAFQQGWGDLPLADALLNTRRRDQMLGHTSVGPHRGDWSVGYEHLPSRESFSRGQEKLTVLACLLAQAQLFHMEAGTWPIVLLDDLASELDAAHLALTLSLLARSDAQVFVTGTAVLPALADPIHPSTLFHVEQGALKRLL